jgi:hypothetical protein
MQTWVVAVAFAKQAMVVRRVKSRVQHDVLHAHVGFDFRHHTVELIDVRRAPFLVLVVGKAPNV